jgi:hypothetical protein
MILTMKAINSLHSINQMIFVMVKRCVFLKLINYLNLINSIIKYYLNDLRLQRVNTNAYKLLRLQTLN